MAFSCLVNNTSWLDLLNYANENDGQSLSNGILVHKNVSFISYKYVINALLYFVSFIYNFYNF